MLSPPLLSSSVNKGRISSFFFLQGSCTAQDSATSCNSSITSPGSSVNPPVAVAVDTVHTEWHQCDKLVLDPLPLGACASCSSGKY